MKKAGWNEDDLKVVTEFPCLSFKNKRIQFLAESGPTLDQAQVAEYNTEHQTPKQTILS